MGKTKTTTRKQKAPKIHGGDAEFPSLAKLGLYASHTTGDGNCLFRAISEQLHGSEAHHSQLRSEAIKHIIHNEAHFKCFIGDYGESFDEYVNRMKQDGVYGGHLELSALSEALELEIVIYQADLLYVLGSAGPAAKHKVHIAYHTYEHYSSVRNKAGPHDGLPNVSPVASAYEPPKQSDGVPQWKVDVVMRGVPRFVSEVVVREMLEKSDPASVIEELIIKEDPSAGSDPPESGPVVSAPAAVRPKAKRQTAREKKDAKRRARYEKDIKKAAEKRTAPSSKKDVASDVSRVYI